MKKILKIIGIGAVAITVCTASFVAYSINKWQTALDTKESWNSRDGKIYTNIVYDQKTGNTFDLYIPANADKSVEQGVILFIHGGGWSGGSKKEMAFACRRYTKAGYITATMDYSLLSKKHPEVTILTMVDEIDEAIGKLKTEIEGKGFTAGKLALMGGSAGGHLAMLYAYSRKDSSAIPIAFVASQSGPVGKTEAETTDEYTREISPIQWVNENSVPTLLAHGKKDSIVPYAGTMELIEKLKEYHVPYDFVDYPNSNHTLESDPESHKLWREKMLDYCKTYFGY